MIEEHFLNPYEEIRETRHNLPHWQQPGAVYFLTFRQNDSLPKSQRDLLKRTRDSWVQMNPSPWSPRQYKEFLRRFAHLEERISDEGHGTCLLRSPQCRKILERTLMFDEGVKYQHISWAIMPNHAHVLTQVFDPHVLEKIGHSWKGVSSHGINKLCQQEGKFWQDDYYDTMIRNSDHLENVIRYIRRNPEFAKLTDCEFTLFESELARGVP